MIDCYREGWRYWPGLNFVVACSFLVFVLNPFDGCKTSGFVFYFIVIFKKLFAWVFLKAKICFLVYLSRRKKNYVYFYN